jgi:diguanylate cyclase (GGDEF)-like protein
VTKVVGCGPASNGDGAAPPPGARPEGLRPALAELPGRLAGAQSGIAFVYEALDVVAEVFAVEDVAVVVDGSAIGRQVFRRRRPEGAPARRVDELAFVHRSPVGLYTSPSVIDPVTSLFVTHLVDVALRWELARREAGLDALTGLYNRRLYEVSLEQTMARSRRYGWPFALILLDMDNFKLVNDRLGHAGGDAALRVLGGELRASLRSGDVAARIGGDEFALIVLNTDSPQVLDRLRARLEAALDRAALGARLRFSAGVAYFPDDGTDGDALMQAADRRLYAAKAESGG